MSTLEIAAGAMGAGRYAEPLEAAAIRFGIETALQKAHFLAQICVESGHFRTTVESLNYSVEGLRKTFGRHRISDAECERYGRAPGKRADQAMIANIVYGRKWGETNLGNTGPTDGSRFIGRGLKQVTGRDNYLACSIALFGDDRLLNEPEILEFLPHCADSAGWFWRSRKINTVAELDDLEAVTKRVNGGLNGLELRRTALVKAKKLLGVG